MSTGGGSHWYTAYCPDLGDQDIEHDRWSAEQLSGYVVITILWRRGSEPSS